MTLLLPWLNFSKSNRHLQQFGQYDDESTYNGATGCTHTILQRLIKAKTGATPSHDIISAVAGYPFPSTNPGRRGLISGNSGSSEAERVFRRYGLPYRVVFGWSFEALKARMALGPVMLGVRYGWWPEDYGYAYYGKVADGKPNGFAFRHGKTQLTGFEQGYHAVLALGTLMVQGKEHAYANEPNHGSPARPEKPDYDDMLASQLKNAYLQYGSTGRSLLAWIPTTNFRPRGY